MSKVVPQVENMGAKTDMRCLVLMLVDNGGRHTPFVVRSLLDGIFQPSSVETIYSRLDGVMDEHDWFMTGLPNSLFLSRHCFENELNCPSRPVSRMMIRLQRSGQIEHTKHDAVQSAEKLLDNLNVATFAYLERKLLSTRVALQHSCKIHILISTVNT